MRITLVRRAIWPLLVGLSCVVPASACKKQTPPGAGTAAKEEAPAASAKTDLKLEAAASKGAALAFGGVRIGERAKLSSPRCLAVDGAGNLYVADSGNGRIVKFDPAGSEVLSFGKKGTAPGEFQSVVGVAVDPQGLVYGLDPRTGYVLIFAADGKFLRRFGDLGFYSPGGLGVQKNGTMIVADTGGSRIVRIGPDGKLLGEPIAFADKTPLAQPSDVSVTADDAIHVLLPSAGPAGAGALVHFAADGSYSGKAWGTVPVPSTSETPRTAEGPDGRLYLSDVNGAGVVAYAADGKSFTPLEIEGLATPFRTLGGIAVDRQGRVFVSDSEQNAIYRLQPKPAALPVGGGGPKKNG